MITTEFPLGLPAGWRRSSTACLIGRLGMVLADVATIALVLVHSERADETT